MDISFSSRGLTDEPRHSNNKQELWTISKNGGEFSLLHLNNRQASISSVVFAKDCIGMNKTETWRSSMLN